MTAPPPAVYMILARIFLCTSLAASLAWTVDYSMNGAWRNPVGKNLIVKTLIIVGLLTVSALASFFRLSPFWIMVIRWADLGLIAVIGPVMVWRMRVFRKYAGAVIRCSNGHFVSSGALFCPQCGIPVRQPGLADPLPDPDRDPPLPP